MTRKLVTMKVIEFIKENGLKALNEQFGIIVKEYDEGLIVLNYDQISSPKNEITSECRGLILDKEFNIVSRSFDRFFNYGENGVTFDPAKAIAYEKIDGSLIKIYNWNGSWYISTRGTAFAESAVNGWDITFKDMVYKALNVQDNIDFQLRCSTWLNSTSTYVCEVTGVENRVVTRYSGYNLYLLAERDNQTGEYYRVPLIVSDCFGFDLPRIYRFDSIEACLETAKHLPNLEEGYVIYEDEVPVCKVKSPVYTAVHHLRGEGLNPKRIAELVVINEQEEYLTYFEEDRVHFTPYIEALENSLHNAFEVYQEACEIEDQKQFALKVKDCPFAFILFQARKEKEWNIKKVFDKMKTEQKVKFLLGLVQ